MVGFICLYVCAKSSGFCYFLGKIVNCCFFCMSFKCVKSKKKTVENDDDEGDEDSPERVPLRDSPSILRTATVSPMPRAPINRAGNNTFTVYSEDEDAADRIVTFNEPIVFTSTDDELNHSG